MVIAFVGNANAIQAMRAQPASARYLWRAVRLQTTQCAMAEGTASVTAVSARKDTSVHDAIFVLAALTHARLNCKESKLLHNLFFHLLSNSICSQINKVAPLMTYGFNCCY